MTSPARFAFVIALAGGVLATVQAQKSSDGSQLFQRRCGGCHALDRDKEGPRLGGVYGRSAGSVTSFPYSDALKKSGITWTAETLEQWLTDTEKLVPGSDMPFRVESAEERRAIIAYLKQKSDK
jgi:cytochrome c